ncbi:MAG: winged helix-turn-helix transcriptional regulator [Candidatus Jordarchaeales archaeon]|nr:helix-turn-helix transcriptional regulator [Candidatus Jordarchaeia archaeon]
MSEYGGSLHGVALRFTAEMSGFKGELKKYTSVFFDKLAKELLGGRDEVFGRAELNKLLIKIEGFVNELIEELSDKVIVTALKHMQLLLGEVKDVRKLDEVSEELFRSVRDPAERYKAMQRIRELEAVVEELEKEIREHGTRLRELLAKDEKYRVLATLDEAGGGSYSELSEKLGFSKAKLIKYIKELEEAGLVEVERSKSPHFVRVKSVPWRLSIDKNSG